MSVPLTPFPAAEVRRALESHGFDITADRGSEIKALRPDGVSVSLHHKEDGSWRLVCHSPRTLATVASAEELASLVRLAFGPTPPAFPPAELATSAA